MICIRIPPEHANAKWRGLGKKSIMITSFLMNAPSRQTRKSINHVRVRSHVTCGWRHQGIPRRDLFQIVSRSLAAGVSVKRRNIALGRIRRSHYSVQKFSPLLNTNISMRSYYSSYWSAACHWWVAKGWKCLKVELAELLYKDGSLTLEIIVLVFCILFENFEPEKVDKNENHWKRCKTVSSRLVTVLRYAISQW